MPSTLNMSRAALLRHSIGNSQEMLDEDNQIVEGMKPEARKLVSANTAPTGDSRCGGRIRMNRESGRLVTHFEHFELSLVTTINTGKRGSRTKGRRRGGVEEEDKEHREEHWERDGEEEEEEKQLGAKWQAFGRGLRNIWKRGVASVVVPNAPTFRIQGLSCCNGSSCSVSASPQITNIIA
ncbi:hypothetical protein P171DRAFT_446879 [Karstenula rhodostoma CBS 690.94]|uniref:Uncharacterized protein n=1 Tax=Karstenula rhodostoma CBS 690.94 TaxID=1392251 RepID=A0A9P4U9D6_9PLEO|nr:hypothetical protein P171DRAFT_446879 [Karstenula rhodostoma CBS 690.94]